MNHTNVKGMSSTMAWCWSCCTGIREEFLMELTNDKLGLNVLLLIKEIQSEVLTKSTTTITHMDV